MVPLLPSLALREKKGHSVIILLIGALLALSFLDTCDAVDNSTNKEAISMEKGMDFLFAITRGFLQILQPNRIYEKYDLNKLVNDKPYQEESFRDWKKLTMYLIGFAVCAAIGIVFIIVMPIVGCCLCCCRSCCSKCGGKQRKHDPKSARYKRGCYAMFLTMFNTFILFAVVCTFVTNELYKKRFIDDPEVLNVARKGTKDFALYIDKSFRDLKAVAKNRVSGLELDLLTQLKNAGNKTVTKLSKSINVTHVLDEVEDLGEGVIKLNTSVSRLSETLEKLINTGSKLETELDQVKKDVTAKLSKCSEKDCKMIGEYINGTSVNAQFSTLDKQATLLTELKQYLNIPNLAQQAQDKFNSVSKNISDVIDKYNTTIADSFTKISKEMDTSLNFDDLKSAIPTKQINDEFDKALNVYNSNKTYTSIPWYVGLCVASILLLIVVCNYLGILFGLCGERAGENTPCCNRGVAANFLLAGVGFYFIFCWILVILVLIEFLVGGMLYTEFCRYLNHDDPKQLKPILSNFNYTYTAFNEKFDLYTYDVVEKCSKNHSILSSMSFPQSFLENKIPKEQLLKEIEKIDASKITIGDVTIMDKALEDKLNGFKNLKTKVNLTQYELQLNKTVMTTDLNVIASNLTRLNSVANISFEQDAKALTNIMKTTYAQLKDEMRNLGSILADVKINMNLGASIDSLIQTIKAVESKVKKDGDKLIQDIVKDETKNLVVIVNSHITNLIKTVINDVAPCRPLYNILFTFTDIVCTTFLNPLNGFWFSTGWAIFFFLPTIIFATKLAGLYRCWYKRDPTLEVNQGKASPQGMPNGAYDEISSNKYHPPPNHQPYNYGGQQGHHYSGYPVYPPPSYHDTRMNPARY